jgi:pyruvate,water dikinase
MLRSVTMALADPATKLHLLLAGLVGESEANALLSGISGASADLASLGPLVGLARVRDGRMTRADYMERYGHRGPHEMELFAPGSEDDPSWLDRRLAGLGDSVVDVDERLARQRAESQAALARFEARYPHRASRARRELEKGAAAARDREAVRSEVTRLARLMRRYLLRVGALLSLDDAVFFLSLDEAAEHLEGKTAPAARIPARRETYFRQVDLPAYPPLIVGAFDALRWAADPNRRNDYFDSRHAATATTDTLKGFGASAGCVEGVVRRIERVEDGGQIQPGEILVTVTTNVGWTPLFPRLAAIVTDVGAPLSHAAIVARELGIPAVVGCGNATMLLKTGDRVRVDGGVGSVEVLERVERL